VTLTALSLRRDMIYLLGRCNTRVMAGCTITAHNNRIMNKSAGECNKGAGNVARGAIQARRYMANRLATTDRTVMAGRAIAGYAHVVKRRISKIGGVMANGAILVVRSGRYVIREFTHTNPIVMARRAAASNDTGMIIGAGAKGTRGMTNLAILGGRHVFVERGGKRLTARSNTMTGIAPSCQDNWVGVVDAKCGSETLGGMARPTIGIGYWVGGHRGRLGGRVYTGAIVVA